MRDFCGLSTGAEGETRTPTPLRELDPEPSVSTNSTTSARKRPYRKRRCPASLFLLSCKKIAQGKAERGGAGKRPADGFARLSPNRRQRRGLPAGTGRSRPVRRASDGLMNPGRAEGRPARAAASGRAGSGEKTAGEQASPAPRACSTEKKKVETSRISTCAFYAGAEGETRTPTPLRELDPEPSVSTNSTTSARKRI